MTRDALLPALLILLTTAAAGQSAPITLPAGTQLPVSIPTHLPMKAGEPIRAELLYPVYVGDQLVLPVRTVVTGSVVSLTPNRSRRIQSRLRADFTPFHIPVVRFDSIVAPDGSSIPITTTEATDGAPIYRVVRAPEPKGGIIGRYYNIALGYGDDTVNGLFGPGKADRFLQFLYSQLPYHPERISQATAWTVETSAPVEIASALAAPPPLPPPAPSHLLLPSHFMPFHARRSTEPVAAPSGERPTWVLQAYLNDPISSEFSKTAQPIHATVAEPVLNPDGSVAVPVGSILSGTVNQARPARRFDRSGVLRFTFSEIQLPGQARQQVRTSIAGADSASAADLAMNSEGQVKPKPQDKIIIPALLVLLALRPMDGGEHGRNGDMTGKDAAGSSGLGLISLIVGTAARQPNLAAGIGFYSVALSLYPRYLGKGRKVSFPKDTRIVIETIATRSTAIKPDADR